MDEHQQTMKADLPISVDRLGTSPQQRVKLLIIEDNVDDQFLLETYLSKQLDLNYAITFAQSVTEAQLILSEKKFDIILVDYYLPDSTGPEFIKENKEYINTPFIVLTGRIDKEVEDLVLASGASDFIPKNELNASLLERVLRFTLEREKTQNLLKEQALRDPLTGLYNRLGMEQKLNQMLSRAYKNKQQLALILIDVDRFKNINDTYGHTTGDTVLKIIAQNLMNSTRCSQETDTAIRIGGDEFALIASELEETENINFIIDRITEKLNNSFEVAGYDIFLELSIGIAVSPHSEIATEDLIKQATTALHRAKKKSGMAIEFFDQATDKKLQKEKIIETSLTQAIKENQLLLHYQPKIITENGTIEGSEALVRWNHPDLGMVWPREFIHLAEETGHILQIGEWVLREACQQTVKWQKMSGTQISVSINVSIRQLLHNSFLEMINNIIEETSIDPKTLELEITESLVIQNLKQSLNVLRKLRKMGISVSLDDFGTGYSSLSRLKVLPINKLKLDRSLIRKVGKNKYDTAIAKTVLTLAKNLKLTAIAEGVETEEQYYFLKKAKCAQLQGHYFSRPIPAQEFEEKYVQSNIAKSA